MAIKNVSIDEKENKSNASKADWDRILRIKDGEAVTIMLLRPIDTVTPEPNGLYSELKYNYRDIWYPDRDKPANLKGRSIELPILEFETPNMSHLSPMNYLAKHPELVKSPSGADVKVSSVKTKIYVVVKSTEIYNASDPEAIKNSAYKFSDELMILNPSMTLYKDIVSAYRAIQLEEGFEPVGIPIKITRHGSKLQDTKYTPQILVHKKDKSFDPYSVEINIDLMDYVFGQTFKAQKSFLSTCGIDLDIENPDPEEEEDFSAESVEEAA